jgi:hypothetical protein
MIAVADASPLCYLVLIGEIDLLPGFFVQVAGWCVRNDLRQVTIGGHTRGARLGFDLGSVLIG